jgi:glycosyltransferase involved in cell wall biosynthesis
MSPSNLRPPTSDHRIVMVGTSPETHGGISAVVNAWRAGGLFARWAIDYVETHCDGTLWDKFACALHAVFLIAALAIRHRDALLHVHAASRASFWRKAVFMLLAMAAGWRYIFHLHGGGFARFYEKECGPMGRAVVRFFLDRATAIVVVSERWATWMRSITMNRRIVTLPNAVAVPAAFNAERSGALVAFVGRCEPGKGVLDLVEAIASLVPAIPSIRLEIAGDGDVDAVTLRAADLGIGAHVYLHGWVSKAQRDELLARATVFALPSHAEGLPLALLEAMAAGCPVVASAVGGVPDVVSHGVNGFLVAPQDPQLLAASLHRVLTDKPLAARLGSAARDTVEACYSIEKTLDSLEQLYAGLGGSRAPARAQPATRRLQEIS